MRVHRKGKRTVLCSRSKTCVVGDDVAVKMVVSISNDIVLKGEYQYLTHTQLLTACASTRLTEGGLEHAVEVGDVGAVREVLEVLTEEYVLAAEVCLERLVCLVMDGASVVFPCSLSRRVEVVVCVAVILKVVLCCVLYF